MKFRGIEAYRRWYGVREMCRWLGVSRSGYYAWTRRGMSRRAQENQLLLGEIRRIHQESRRCYGSPRIVAELRARGMGVSAKRVERLMRGNGLRARHRRKYKHTTDSRHPFPIASNVLGRRFTAEAANRMWVADITYISTGDGWLYLSAIMDLYSRRIVGWATSERITRSLVIGALRMALLDREPKPGLLHHSDQGSQYASIDYQMMLKRNGIRCSMNRAGDCYDNAAMESFFSSMKREWVQGKNYQTREEARRDLFEYIEIFYNRKRRHSTLGQVSPVEFEGREKCA